MATAWGPNLRHVRKAGNRVKAKIGGGNARKREGDRRGRPKIAFAREKRYTSPTQRQAESATVKL
jgi:hypothetical protein